MTIVDGVRAGRIDVCRDSRWPLWQFDAGKGGRALIGRLRALETEASGIGATNDSAAGALERSRLRALWQVLAAVQLAPRRADWERAFARADTRYLNWRARASAQRTSGLPLMLARRAVWRLMSARISEQRIHDPVAGGIGSCLMEGDYILAEHEVVGYVLDALERGRYPTEAQDGAGATSAAIALPETRRGVNYVSNNWSRLAGVAPRGVLPLWRVASQIDPSPPASADAFAQRFVAEWAEIEAMFKALPAPANVGEELYRRTRPEQYGRVSVGIVADNFAADPKRQDAAAAIWERTSATDGENTARVKVLLQTREWFDDERDGDGAEFYGWLIVQHSDKEPDFQREVLGRMERLLPQGRVRRRNYAYLWDRVAAADGRPQRYGTQYICKNGKYELRPTEEPAKLNARRKAMGMEPAPPTIAGKCG